MATANIAELVAATVTTFSYASWIVSKKTLKSKVNSNFAFSILIPVAVRAVTVIM